MLARVLRMSLLCSVGITLVMGSGVAPPINAQTEEAEGPGFRFKQMLLYDLGRVEEKIVGLADVMPADTYGWRPAEGVRSVSESFMHICAVNQFLLGRIGLETEGDQQELEKITDKNQVIESLKHSFATVKDFVSALSQDELDSEIEFFGQKRPRAVELYVLQSHLHEHLGQAIAYARSNGVVPPWSQPREGAEG